MAAALVVAPCRRETSGRFHPALYTSPESQIHCGRYCFCSENEASSGRKRAVGGQSRKFWKALLNTLALPATGTQRLLLFSVWGFWVFIVLL